MDKLAQLKQVLSQWCGKIAYLKRDLLSIIGSLSHASKVVKLGRAFTRRLIDLSKSVKRPHHHVQLSLEAWSDIEWWYRFVEEWNGVSLFRGLRTGNTQRSS